MQRMGDLIMSFPLFLWLKKTYPGHRIQVVGEKIFYEGLVEMSPEVLYVPWQRREFALKEDYRLVINLSHRPEAAWLAGKVKSEELAGPYLTDSKVLRIAGQWQLYRSSIVHNNRYNRFHWAELNALDVVPWQLIGNTRWNQPETTAGNQRIGLFIGASQSNKRPGTEFYALLCNELVRCGYQPVILGGPGEKDLAGKIIGRCRVKPLSLVGRLNLIQLGKVCRGLNLLITPDTGPMHLAAWIGLKTLNLSLGPVNPWETGPYQPGHLVMRSSVSCTGCWECTRRDPMCAGTFRVRQVMVLVREMLCSGPEKATARDFKGVNVFRTGRKRGLYALESVKAKHVLSNDLAGFWQSFWKFQFGLESQESLFQNALAIHDAHPFLKDRFSRCAVSFLAELKRLMARGSLPDRTFWRDTPPYFRPFTGYVHLMWQNSDYSSQSLTRSIELAAQLADLFSPGP